MASISKTKLSQDIRGILKGADLSTLSAKKIRRQLEEKYGHNLDSRKSEIDAMVMKAVNERQDESEKEEETKHNESSASDLSEDSDDSEFNEPEDIGPPAKKSKKSKHQSDNEDDEEIARKLQEQENSGSRRTRGGKKPPATKKKKKSEGGRRANNRYMQELTLSPALADIVGQNKMARSDVVKKMWQIIKERNLQDPKQKQFMLCDDQLYTIFGRKRVKTFGMMKYLKDHMFTEDA